MSLKAVLATTSGAVGLAVAATVAFATMHAMVRQLSGELHPFEIAFFRSVVGLLVITPVLLKAGASVLRVRRPGLMLLRGATGGASMLLWFFGLSVVPIATATALSFTSVLFASLGAVLFLRERMGLRRSTALAVGFLGALIILRPGVAELAPGAVVVLLSALSWGVSVCMVKVLTRTESTITLVAWMGAMTTLITVVPAYLVWVTPSLPQLGWLVLIGALGTAGTYAFTHAIRFADATLIMPVDFTRLVWAAALGYVLFAEVPDVWTWVGGLVIVGSTAYIGLREAHLARQRRAAAAG